MNVVILGATGTFGTQLTQKLLLDTNYQLTLVSRSARSVYEDNERVTVINADVTDLDNLRVVLENQDIVYCAISGEQLPVVAKNLVDAMNDSKARLIFMGAIGIYNEIPYAMDGQDNVENNPDQICNRDAVEIIENSQLNYTVFRPGYLRDGDDDDYVITKKGEFAKGYITTIPSVIKITLDIMKNNKLYLHESIGITKDMTNI